MNKRVLIGISGGIDSAVAAALLKTQGYDLVGAYIQFWDEKEVASLKVAGGSCCNVRSAEHAKKVCDELEMPLHIIHGEEVYQSEVLDYVVHEYLSTRLPNPCVMCNSAVKFNLLIKKADELKCDYIATGHYAKIVHNSDNAETNLYRATEESNDQSYFLFGLKQEQLARTLMPLGDLLKANIRKMARTFELPAIDREQMTRLCFADDGGYLDMIAKRAPDRYKPPGPIVTSDGSILGRHSGLYKYHIGQKQGLGLESKPDHKDSVVLGFDVKLNALIVGPEKDLNKKSLLATNCNWIGVQDFSRGIRAKAKSSSFAESSACRITLLNNSSVLVDFDEPQGAIAPGQAIVFYTEDLVIGGGWIESLTEPVSTKLRSKGMALTI